MIAKLWFSDSREDTPFSFDLQLNYDESRVHCAKVYSFVDVIQVAVLPAKASCKCGCLWGTNQPTKYRDAPKLSLPSWSLNTRPIHASKLVGSACACPRGCGIPFEVFGFWVLGIGFLSGLSYGVWSFECGALEFTTGVQVEWSGSGKTVWDFWF